MCTPMSIEQMRDDMPDAYEQLKQNCEILEREYKDMQVHPTPVAAVCRMSSLCCLLCTLYNHGHVGGCDVLLVRRMSSSLSRKDPSSCFSAAVASAQVLQRWRSRVTLLMQALLASQTQS